MRAQHSVSTFKRLTGKILVRILWGAFFFLVRLVRAGFSTHVRIQKTLSLCSLWALWFNKSDFYAG
jgi:hypothetical protein